jgi:hypothetical protein
MNYRYDEATLRPEFEETICSVAATTQNDADR